MSERMYFLSLSLLLFTGLDYEGVFRINGNSKVIERLRAAYDKNGEVNLIEVADLMAVASLIKLFLRELPEGVVPERYTALMVQRQQGEWYRCVEGDSVLEQMLRKGPGFGC